MLISIVPIAFAEERTNTDVTRDSTVSDTDVSDEDDSARIGRKARRVAAAVKRAIMNDTSAVLKRGRIAKDIREEKFFKEFKEEGARIRKIHKERIKALRDDLKQAKEQAKEAKKKYADLKKQVGESRKRLKDCDPSVEDCEALKREFAGKFKQTLLTAIEYLGDILDQVESRILSSEYLSDAEEKRIVAKLSELREQIQGLTSDVDQLPEDAEPEEIRNTVKQVRRVVGELKKDLGHLTSVLKSGHLGGILVRAHQMEAQLQRLLDWAEKKGKDVSGLEELVDSFHAHLEEAKEAFRLAQEAKDAGDKRAFNEHLKTAKENLKTAHRVLVDVMKQVKQHKLESQLQNIQTGAEDDDEEDECVIDADCDEDEYCDKGECEDVEDDEADEDKEEASEEIEDAEEEIAKAAEKITEAQEDGKETSEAEAYLAEAREALSEAQSAFVDGLFEEAEEFAEEAKDLASEAREYIGTEEGDEAGDNETATEIIANVTN